LLRNNAINYVVEPGSTFKVVVLAGILQENLFKVTDKINCENGKLEVAGQIIKDHEKQGVISVSQVIEYSSNIGTAKLALALGAERFYKYIKMFGFNSMTGIDLNGEEKGLLKPTAQWSKRSLHTISFGQEIATTPLQTVNAFSAIANGGVLLKPKIIKSIGDVNYQSKEVIRRVVSDATSYKMRQILKNVVDKGTGKSAKIKGYTVGGKTGTAQKIDPQTGKYSTKHYVASFCGMVPAMDPEIVILVMFDEPKGEYYAASVAAPVFAKIASKTADI
jgi:cell division protein FtsI (penicillin-binding protein 3)